MFDVKTRPRRRLRATELAALACRTLAYVLTALVVAIVLTSFLVTVSFRVHTAGAVVVTGASSGIGEDAAAALAAATSFTVYAGVRKQGDADRLEAAYPGLRTVFIDVTDAESVAAAVRHV
eukprot:746240-Prymnesium_polylepis.1